MFTRTERKKARLLDLVTTVLELVRDGKRDPDRVAGALQRIKEDPNFAEATTLTFKEKPTRPGQIVRAMLRDWEKFYKEVFGLEKNFSGLRIPSKQPGFDRLLVVAQGMTPNRIYNRMKELMPVWKYWGNLNSITSGPLANHNHDYAIWVRDRVEADEELKNKSADDLKAEGIPGITLEERLLFELKYFKETNKHLDIDKWTLCSGSRRPNGRVPCVRWLPYDGRVDVGWYYADGRRSDLRARAVVSV